MASLQEWAATGRRGRRPRGWAAVVPGWWRLRCVYWVPVRDPRPSAEWGNAPSPTWVLAQVLKEAGPGHEEELRALSTQRNADPAGLAVDRTGAGEPGACFLPACAQRRAVGISLDTQFPLSACCSQLLCHPQGRETPAFSKLNSFPGPAEFCKGWLKPRRRQSQAERVLIPPAVMRPWASLSPLCASLSSSAEWP